MRTLSALVLFLFLYTGLFAQVTLVREAPNDSFNLACTDCTLTITDFAITRGQHAIPMNMRKPVSVNLLMWRYYDDILRKEVLMANEPFWTTGVQLIEEIPDTVMLSLHLNLDWTDSTGMAHRFYLVLAGLTKHDMSRLPLETTYDPDTYAIFRFAAIAQIVKEDDEDDWETYDSFEGSCFLNSLNTKTRSVGGTFSFIGNRIGMEKLGIFTNGVFQK
ncbi:MAG: hypothetical protein EP344_00280 [Bacteroidetes bacterium]|nr:MAG: hypothetical protein EP344_00280 [Bacteroidota bacterium]